jgi:CheY-like chemotaxis protein
MLPKITGPDVLRTLKGEARTAGIPVVVFTGLSQRNAERLLGDGACGFLEKSDLGLDKGSERLLSALAKIVAGFARPAGSV